MSGFRALHPHPNPPPSRERGKKPIPALNREQPQ